MKTTPRLLAFAAILFSSVSRAQTVRVGAGPIEVPAGVAAAGAAPSLALPASYVTLSLADGLPAAAKAPVVSPRHSLSVGVENVSRAPSPVGANAALDAMYSASKARPAAAVAASYAPSLSGPDLKPSDGKAEARKAEVPSSPKQGNSPAETGAQLAVVAAAIAALATAVYFMAQAFTSMVIQWEAELRAAQDFWSQMP